MKRNKKSFIIITLLFVFIGFLSQCINNKTVQDPRGAAFAQPQTCRQCHRAIYDSALLTAHYNASASAKENNILGKFTAGHNSFIYDSLTKVVMEKRDSGWYQVLYSNGEEKEARRFDIIFGFTHAQTSLYWKGDNTFELPVSYYTSINDWATSPGFSNSSPNFNRLIGRDCYECHSSFIASKKNETGDGYFSSADVVESLNKRSLVYGIDCQRCHGPAAQHVSFHEQNRKSNEAKYIVTKGSLNRQQQLDACAVCHSGNDKIKLKSRFAYMPGDPLQEFFIGSSNSNNNGNFDVHGNQFNLLKQSQCFLQSKTLTCNSCHNTHNPSRENLSMQSKNCMNCHTEAENNFCTVKSPAIAVLKENCIDCHMPKQPSSAINFQLAGSNEFSSYLLRTHLIKVYTEK